MIQHIVIAIDGPAASGKTTVGILVAKRLGISFLDSGRLYRVAAVASEKLGLDLPQLLDKIDLELKNGLFILDGQDVTDLLGTVEIGEKASQMSVDPALREWVNKTIRGLAAEKPILVTGRDMGTVVLTDADLKIYLDANVEERARRRFLELKKSKPYDEILEGLKVRDKRDSSRDIAPLRPAENAVKIDSTIMTVGQVAAKITELAKKTLNDLKAWPFWRFSYWVCWNYSRRMFDFELHGKGNIPRRGPVIVVANHTSILDVFFMGLAFPKAGRFLAKEELFRIPVIGAALRSLGTIPVRRGNTTKDTVRAVSKTLQEKGIFGIYPEGTRSLDGKLSGRYQTGAVQFAHKYGAKVVPVGIIGSDKALPVGSKKTKKAKVIVNVGKPMDFSGLSGTRASFEDAIEQVMREVARLSNQEYVPLDKS